MMVYVNKVVKRSEKPESPKKKETEAKDKSEKK